MASISTISWFRRIQQQFCYLKAIQKLISKKAPYFWADSLESWRFCLILCFASNAELSETDVLFTSQKSRHCILHETLKLENRIFFLQNFMTNRLVLVRTAYQHFFNCSFYIEKIYCIRSLASILLSFIVFLNTTNVLCAQVFGFSKAIFYWYISIILGSNLIVIYFSQISSSVTSSIHSI